MPYPLFGRHSVQVGARTANLLKTSLVRTNCKYCIFKSHRVCECIGRRFRKERANASAQDDEDVVNLSDAAEPHGMAAECKVMRM